MTARRRRVGAPRLVAGAGAAAAPPAAPTRRQAEALLDAASAAIGAIRKAKSQARLPMRASVQRLAVTAPAPQLAALAEVLADVRAAGTVAEVELREAAAGEPVHE